MANTMMQELHAAAQSLGSEWMQWAVLFESVVTQQTSEHIQQKIINGVIVLMNNYER